MGRTVLAFVAVAFLTRTVGAADAKPGPADFSGAWILDEASSSDKGTNADVSQEASKPQVGGRGGGGNSLPGAGTSTDIPFEAMVDAQRINVLDEGTKLRVTYISGRQRLLFLDGEERELDDGGGPAKVIGKRKGDRQVVVSSKWHGGSTLYETWEIQSNPARLTVTGKGKGRHSFSYKRVYGLTADETAPVASTPAAGLETAPAAPAKSEASTSSASAPISIPWGKAECSIKPPRGATPEELARLAKISSGDAATRASDSVKPVRVTSVISSDVEVHEGCLVYPIDVRLTDRKGVQEVFIDAGDGKVLGSEFEASDAKP